MRWTERQQAMLREMGLRLWLPDGPAVDAPEALSAANAANAVNEAPPARGPMALGDADAPLVPVASVSAAVPAAETAAVASPLREAPPARSTPPEPPVDVPPARGGRPTIATLDWPALEGAVAGCTACGLCRTRRQTVFGVGHHQAHCMVVGEAPGEQEDRQGEPFVGPAGQLLDRMLAAIGLTRGEAPPERQVFIANALKCRPPGNRNPTPEEMAHCVPFLERQVALVQPRVVLAMGRFAVQSLLQTDEAIGRLRGRVHHWQGRALVVTYHPAYLLRQPADKAKAWDDLCLAAELLANERP